LAQGDLARDVESAGGEKEGEKKKFSLFFF